MRTQSTIFQCHEVYHTISVHEVPGGGLESNGGEGVVGGEEGGYAESR